jgi:hypothetical protein
VRPSVVGAVALAGLASCSTSQPFREPFPAEASLVFGYIDMRDAPSDLRWINMKRIRPLADRAYYGFNIERGFFYRTAVPEGLYKFHEFGGHSFRLGGIDTTFAFPTQGKHEMDPVIKAPGIYYVGSYKYVKQEAPMLELRYKLVRVNEPGEGELLRRLLSRPMHPTWKQRIEQRLKETAK